MIGIPVYIFYLMNMGKILARFLKWMYTKVYRWNVRRKWRNEVNYRPNVNGGENQDLDEAYLDELEKQVRYIFVYLYSFRSYILKTYNEKIHTKFIISNIYPKHIFRCLFYLFRIATNMLIKPYRIVQNC